MKSRIAVAAVSAVAMLALPATASAEGNLPPKQAAAKCKAERKADPAEFKVRYGVGPKKRAAFARCFAAKVVPEVDAIIEQVSSQLPQLPELPDGLPATLPEPACDAINSVLSQFPGLNLNQLLVMLPSQLAFLQNLIGGQFDALVSQVQGQLATVCPQG